MASLSIAIQPKINHSRRILVELDAERFERLAANLGFFSAEFLKSLDRAVRDEREGKMRKIKSLKDLR